MATGDPNQKSHDLQHIVLPHDLPTQAVSRKAAIMKFQEVKLQSDRKAKACGHQNTAVTWLGSSSRSTLIF
jgi:hypothetical protein